MTMKSFILIALTAALFSCTAYAGHGGHAKGHHAPHHGHYDRPRHKNHHHKHHKHYYKHHRRSPKCYHHAGIYGAAYSPVYPRPELELGIRYGFPAGEAVVVYRSPHH